MGRPKWDEDTFTDPEPSECAKDPYRRLMAAVLLKAIIDLQNSDPIISLDALDWLASREAGLWLEAALGVELETDHLFKQAIGGATNDRLTKPKPRKHTEKRNREYERRGAKDVPAHIAGRD